MLPHCSLSAQWIPLRSTHVHLTVGCFLSLVSDVLHDGDMIWTLLKPNMSEWSRREQPSPILLVHSGKTQTLFTWQSALSGFVSIVLKLGGGDKNSVLKKPQTSQTGSWHQRRRQAEADAHVRSSAGNKEPIVGSTCLRKNSSLQLTGRVCSQAVTLSPPQLLHAPSHCVTCASSLAWFWEGLSAKQRVYSEKAFGDRSQGSGRGWSCFFTALTSGIKCPNRGHKTTPPSVVWALL